jgi:hypothetical protein
MVVITLPHDPTWQALEWAKKNCPSYITNKINESIHSPHKGFFSRNYYIDYFFSDPKDAVIFSLKWS